MDARASIALSLAALLHLGPATASGLAAAPQDALPEIASPSAGADQAAVARRNRNVIVGSGLVLGLYGTNYWWKDGFTGRFRTVNEGWFGQDTYSGGADKMGHLFFTYAGTRMLARGFEAVGNEPEHALRLSAVSVFGALLAVEAADGFSKKWRFSKEDVAMNGIGTGLAVLFEKSPELDRAFDLRLLYWPSGAARRQGKIDPFGDYSGQTYLLVAKAAAVPALRRHPVLRYLEVAVGYGTRGYEPDEGPGATRTRHGYLGISLNLAELLDNSVFRENRDSRTARITRQVLEYVQVPGTAALADHTF